MADSSSSCCIQDEHFEDALSVLKQISTGNECSISMGKYYPENGLHINMSGEPDKVIVKEEDHHPCGMVSQALFRPVPGMVPGCTQAPSSTTIDLGDHKQMGFPHFDSQSVSSPDPRKLRSEGGAASSRLCQVCSDNASGFHYGVWSCEGCKAFFKRSIQGPVDYICPATNSCTIDKHRRKSCQACRLRKCYEVGMNKASQRKDRKNSVAKAPKRSRADSTETTVNSTSSSPIPAKCSRRTNSAAIVDALTKADLPVLESYHNYSLPPTKTHLLTSLVKITERELVQLINWAKNVPGYTDLSLSDQVHLIERCWMELLLFNCAFHSMKHDGKKVVFAPDFSLDRIDWHTIGMIDVLEQVAAVSEQLVLYGLHREEILLLQATVLVNAEVRRLSSFGRIFEIRQVILDALSDMGQKYHPENQQHVPSILLLLSHIRQAGERCIAYFQSVKSEACVGFSELLTEMLDSHSGPKSSINAD